MARELLYLVLTRYADEALHTNRESRNQVADTQPREIQAERGQRQHRVSQPIGTGQRTIVRAGSDEETAMLNSNWEEALPFPLEHPKYSALSRR